MPMDCIIMKWNSIFTQESPNPQWNLKVRLFDLQPLVSVETITEMVMYSTGKGKKAIELYTSELQLRQVINTFDTTSEGKATIL